MTKRSCSASLSDLSRGLIDLFDLSRGLIDLVLS